MIKKEENKRVTGTKRGINASHFLLFEEGMVSALDRFELYNMHHNLGISTNNNNTKKKKRNEFIFIIN
jgi:hypothetical protein